MVVFACLPNFICNSVDPKAFDQVQGMTDTVNRHLSVIRTYASSNPSILVAVAKPLCRQSPVWFFSQYGLLQDVFRDLFGQLKTPNMYMFTAPDPKKLQFNSDLIHLTPKCGELYLSIMFEQSSDLFTNVARYSSTVIASTAPTTGAPATTSKATPPGQATEVIDDSDSESFLSFNDTHDNDVTVIQETRSETVTLDMLYSEIKKTNDVMSKVNTNEREISSVRKLVTAGFKSTDLAIARIYEDQDFASNVAKENRVTIGSLVLSETTLPADRSAWIVYLTAKVNSMIKDLFKSNTDLIPVLVGVAVRPTRLNFKKEFPNFDAIFQSSAHALVFRRELGLATRKDSGAFKSIFVSNSVTLATRVRIEVMLSLSKHLNQNGFTCHVQSFVSRPVIHVKPPSSQVAKVYTYVDCVREFSGYFDTLDLTSAYRRAGTFFDGTLSRFFVVLTDGKSQSLRQQRSKQPNPSGNVVSGKRKR